jgi:signal peptidase II
MKRGLNKAAQAVLKWKYIILILLTGIILVLDQVTKTLVVSKFRLGESIPVISDYFNLTYVQNKGAAFGILAQANPAFRVPFFIIVPLIALASISFVFKKIGDKDIKLSIALSLVIAGAIGNLVDRLTLGYVIDFLDFHWRWGYHFPAFNVADSAICVGVGILMLDLVVNDSEALSSSQKKGSRLNASHTR